MGTVVGSDTSLPHLTYWWQLRWIIAIWGRAGRLGLNLPCAHYSVSADPQCSDMSNFNTVGQYTAKLL